MLSFRNRLREDADVTLLFALFHIGNAGGNAKSSFFGGNMTKAINNGSVEMERLDDMGTRILA